MLLGAITNVLRSAETEPMESEERHACSLGRLSTQKPGARPHCLGDWGCVVASDQRGGEQHQEQSPRQSSAPAGPRAGGVGWLDRPGVRALAAGVFAYIIVAALVQVLQHLGYGDFGALTLFGFVLAFVCASLAYYGGAAAARAVQLAGLFALLAFVAAGVVTGPARLASAGGDHRVGIRGIRLHRAGLAEYLRRR